MGIRPYTPSKAPGELLSIPRYVYREFVKLANYLYEVLGGDVWYDMLSPITSAGRRGAATDFSWTNYNATGIYQPDFDVNDDAIAVFHINHDIKRNSKMYPHVHWSTDGTDTNPVYWELNYVFASRDDVTPTVFSSKQTITLEGTPSGTAFAHHVTECTDAEAVDAPEVDSIILFQLKRITNGATDNTDTVFGHFLDIHYQRDRFGTPNKAPDFYK